MTAPLCWRHELRLMIAAVGSLLDLSGRLYPKWSGEILLDARHCPRCHHP